MTRFYFSGTQKQDDRQVGFQVEVTTKLMEKMGLTERQTSNDSDQNDWGYFGLLTVSYKNARYIYLVDMKMFYVQDEVIQLILQYLDTVSLTNVALTCKYVISFCFCRHRISICFII